MVLGLGELIRLLQTIKLKDLQLLMMEFQKGRINQYPDHSLIMFGSKTKFSVFKATHRLKTVGCFLFLPGFSYFFFTHTEMVTDLMKESVPYFFLENIFIRSEIGYQRSGEDNDFIRQSSRIIIPFCPGNTPVEAEETGAGRGDSD